MRAHLIDVDLIEAARCGQTPALERLLVICEADIRRYAEKACIMTDVDDAVQEALFIMAKHITSMRHAAAFSRWIFQVVRRECRRLARRTLRLDPWEEAKLETLLASRSYDVLRMDVANALEALPKNYRDVIVLRDFEDLTIGDIADKLNLTRAAVKSRLHRARQMTRQSLVG